ncbi:MAG: HlyD family efflux transporter periplasmic adaptor subunit [Rhizobiales bacterium]|nr:HlyD family efflux transporter periplasmic adaptor subunit [Hyphomicrobiales bacterium]
MRFRRSLPLITTLVMLLLPAQQSLAHEGHDHDTTAKSVAVPALPRAEAISESFELVAVARSGEVVIYLDRFATNEPVPDATVVVETSQGSAEAKPFADGTYRLAAPWAAFPGRYDLIATVTQGTNADVLAFTREIPQAMQTSPRRATAAALVAAAILPFLALGAFAHEGEDHGAPQVAQPAGTKDVAQVLADGSVFVPKSTQRILAIRTIVSEPSVYRRTVELPGRIIPDPNASGFVQTVVGGRLSPPEGGFPRLGTRVKKGDILAYVTPPLQAIDVSTMRQQQGDLDQQISIVERRLARYETLAPSGAVARSQLEDTRLELQGLRERRASLDKVKREPEALVAPVDGIVAEGTPVAGQVVQTNQVVFQIIDPARLWIEALSYESLPALQSAAARVGDKEFKLVFRGAGFADRNQSIPIHFAIEGDISGVRVGQFVTVFADTPDEQRGLAVPRTSIVRTTAGQDSVFEHVSAERFEQRMVRVEPLDGQRVLISQGLTPGKRVVVQGAELLDHIR